jgi:uncharacterized protein (UPF0332 family)
MTTVDDCFEKGQLKKASPDIAKARASLKIAKSNIDDAKVHLETKLYNWALVASYASMFHSARALLFKDGLKERSHFCLCLYVREKYKGVIEGKYLNELNVLREQRHGILYGDENIKLKEVHEEEADSAVKIASGFLQIVEKIIT